MGWACSSLRKSLTSFWLWLVDAFHGRLYASAFLTPALGCWWLANYGETAAEDLVMGLNLLVGWISNTPRHSIYQFNSPARSTG